MKSIGNVLDQRPQSIEQLTVGSNKVRTIDNSTIVDRALEQTSDLITEQFKPWYAKQAIRLGADRYLGIASDARRGKSPSKLFSYLLRRTV